MGSIDGQAERLPRSGAGGLDLGVGGVLEALEVLDEHRRQLAGLAVVGVLVGPSSAGLEYLGRDARAGGRDLEAEAG